MSNCPTDVVVLYGLCPEFFIFYQHKSTNNMHHTLGLVLIPPSSGQEYLISSSTDVALLSTETSCKEAARGPLFTKFSSPQTGSWEYSKGVEGVTKSSLSYLVGRIWSFSSTSWVKWISPVSSSIFCGTLASVDSSWLWATSNPSFNRCTALLRLSSLVSAYTAWDH